MQLAALLLGQLYIAALFTICVNGGVADMAFFWQVAPPVQR
jgi:hypothetical protein